MNSLTSFIHSHSFYIISLFLTCLPKKIQKLLIELFIGVRIPNIYLAFFTQSCFAVPKKKKKNVYYVYFMFHQEKSTQTRAPTNRI